MTDRRPLVLVEGRHKELPAGDKVPFSALSRAVGADAVTGGPVILVPDPYRKAVEQQSGGRQTVLYDDHGNPSVMYVIPRFRYQDLGYSTEFGTGNCTAFEVDGQVKSEIFIGAYQACNLNGLAASLPGRQVWRSITWDNALAACTNKGSGWGMMTVHEWAAIALYCMANGYEPRGNTNHGRAHNATHEFGRREDGGDLGGSGGVGNILAGTGPDAWRHDGSSSGIADLVGNVWEWLWGMKTIDGQIHIAPDNNITLPEAEWATSIDGNEHWFSAEDTVRLQNTQGVSTDHGSVVWSSLNKEAGYTESQLLQRLLISPAGIHPQGTLYGNASGERFPLRGGSRINGGDAGLAALNLNNDAGPLAGTTRGFRLRFVL